MTVGSHELPDAGRETQASLHLAPDTLAATPRPSLQMLVERHRIRLRHELEALGASNIRVFGSVARGTNTEMSDVDILVDIDDSIGLFTLGRMRTAAEDVLGVAVDIVPADSLRDSVREQVLVEAVPL